VINGVVFDAFGTIARIGRRTNPYRDLIREGRRQGLALTSITSHIVMTSNLSLDEIASRLGISLTSSKHAELIHALEVELSSIEPYPDAIKAILMLQSAGIKVGICSNLASPYGPAVRSLFRTMDGYAFSFELGVMKPDPHIYSAICLQMDVVPGHCFSEKTGHVLMIGDSPRCDRDGPRAVGIMGFHLDRNDQGNIHDLAKFAELVLDRNNSR
jgi:FMN phosphatase YigB (HAD superfamily)